MPDLLLELFSEEIPARMQARAREDLKKLVTDALVEAGLTYASAGAFSTPRRLVLTVQGLTAESPMQREERKGPKADAPAAALEGFLRSTGLSREQLELRDDKKGQVYFAVLEKPGRKAAEIVAEAVEGAIRGFPWPKSMRWGSGSLRWVRPLHSILCLLSDESGAEVVPVTVDHLSAGNTTEGHRFMAPGRFPVSSFDDYAAKLKRAFVVLDAAEREQTIWHDATTQAFAQGLEVVPDAGLLSEVAGLVEWPVVLMGAIGEDFLGLPPEVLQTSMREHQKFFSVKNPKSGRIEKFVTVANRETADHGETILKGNQKVLSARLSDAKFFWENDLRVAKAGMGEWLDGLKAVTFHNKLGSQHDRIERIAALAREIAPLVDADADIAEQAARLAKADLRSAMVGEFPELQGLMGMYYAREAGFPDAVALAARDHWRPKGEGDSVPTDPVSVAVALADKIDTLTGFWAIDEKPTGSKDPYALRRAALGVIRLVLGNRIRAEMQALVSSRMTKHEAKQAAQQWSDVNQAIADVLSTAAGNEEVFSLLLKSYADSTESLANPDKRTREHEELLGELRESIETAARTKTNDLLSFLHDRLKVYLRDQGIRHDVIDACLAMPGNDDLTLLVKRAEALAGFLKTDDGTNLLQGFKRANNILSQAEAKDGVEYSFGADEKFAETDAERALFTALDGAEAVIRPAMREEDFAAAMTAMASLRAPIDAFFEAVQVNAENPILRRNRLNLLHRIRAICGQVADLTKVEG
ncbi:glycine--tRNA ligase subunit beta [Cereibacter changlensis JA139]|uniref:Glycine--tRNA ligase beta subunit n=2 Tax=Cereibacter changlensis TaxID=402884 RepID=A0A2T4JU01_9RHOB|nr:glycine--tRNA ligase subunit beta [Cereibacter changlensis]PTE21297.1 glycine--tRNA ligase subunit beta [Cereibacter changlensis JA139]PZX53576.1 glycyl-tRNA synthetase beta chain [Cereibacter changlensis]